VTLLTYSEIIGFTFSLDLMDFTVHMIDELDKRTHSHNAEIVMLKGIEYNRLCSFYTAPH